MDTELDGVGLLAADEAPHPEQASVVESQPSEPAPSYVSRDEVLQMLEQLRAEAREYGQRGAQSFIDKRRLNERIQSAEVMLSRLVQDGVIDEPQASVYRHQARLEALTELLPEPEATSVGGEQPYQQPISPVIQKAYVHMAKKGLMPTDPEYVDPLRFEDPIDWAEAVEKAVAQKAARLAREQARQQAVTKQQPQAKQQINAATAIEVGSGGGVAPASLKQLEQQLIDAYRRGDYAARDRVQNEIDRILAAGGG